MASINPQTPNGESANPQNPKGEFTVFPNLTNELQLLIWDEALKQSLEEGEAPQTILISQQSGPWLKLKSTRTYRGLDGTETFETKYSKGMPTFLQTNAYPRAVTQDNYSLLLLDAVENKPKYFNFEKDTLAIRCHPYWGWDEHASPELKRDLAKVQNVIMIGCKNRAEYQIAVESLAPFLQLKKITLYAENSADQQFRQRLWGVNDMPNFWRQTMNPMQIAAGLEATPAPEIALWAQKEFKALQREFRGSWGRGALGGLDSRYRDVQKFLRGCYW